MSPIPEQIGPYRILRRLGAGGMGEVLLAVDERLDRRVAVKRILPDIQLTPERRERFRREAKLAARLNHPAIVQVYDVPRAGQGEHIVMEYVAGTTLRRHLADGPLPVPRVVALAAQLAGGLAEAHAQGVVHRDLKTENVLVTPSWHAKIADFGIAKGLLKEQVEETLTDTRGVLGTSRAMSPEQARGEPVDHRSDLFSFGVLLYEALTGISPFVADNDLATLQRILTHRQAPVRELVPEVPGELSDLVDYLLRKEPELRPRGAGDVAAALRRIAAELPEPEGEETALAPAEPQPPTSAPTPTTLPAATASPPRGRTRRHLWAVALGALALLSAGALLWLGRRPAEPLAVAVLAPRIAGGDSDAALIAAGVRTALAQRLLSLTRISVKDPEEVDAVAGSAKDVAYGVAADEVVSSELTCSGVGCRLSLHRLRGSDGELLWTRSFAVPGDDFELAASVIGNHLGEAYSGFRPRRGGYEAAVASADVEEFLRVQRLFQERGQATSPDLLERLRALRRRSPRFLEALLLEADMERRGFYTSRSSEQLERAEDLLGRARELAPGDPRPLRYLFFVAVAAGRYPRAEELLAELERTVPGDLKARDCEAYLLEARGEAARAIEILHAAVRRQPSWRRLSNLASMEYRHGEIDAARRHLEELLERAPGNFKGLSSLARMELVDGDPKRAIELYRELVEQSARPYELSNLALAYLLESRYEEAADIYRRVFETAPKNPLYALNLADAELLLGERARAEELYAVVLELAAQDPTATDWQLLMVQAQALAHLGRARPAVAAVQAALQQAPDNNQVAFEASLVYALIAEPTSALVNAERALELGYNARWFELPWFDDLRDGAELRALLEGSTPG